MYTIYFGVLWILNILKSGKSDIICTTSFGYPPEYCSGLTAYCCGSEYLPSCCWTQVWKIWWFWVIIVVVVAALLSLCGYYCRNSDEDPYSLLRGDSFFGRFNMIASEPMSPYHEEWKPPDDITLPPYTPSPTNQPNSSLAEAATDPPQNLPYLEPPPPYATVASHPQPTSDESTSLLSGESSSVTARRLNSSTSTTVFSH